MNTNRYRAGQPCKQPLPPTGEQIAKELHARYFKEMPVQMHEPEAVKKDIDLSLRDRFLQIFKKPWSLS